MRARPGPGLLADLLQHAGQLLKPSVCASEVPASRPMASVGQSRVALWLSAGQGREKHSWPVLVPTVPCSDLKDQPRTMIPRTTQDALDLFLAQSSAAGSLTSQLPGGFLFASSSTNSPQR